MERLDCFQNVRFPTLTPNVFLFLVAAAADGQASVDAVGGSTTSSTSSDVASNSDSDNTGTSMSSASATGATGAVTFGARAGVTTINYRKKRSIPQLNAVKIHACTFSDDSYAQYYTL